MVPLGTAVLRLLVPSVVVGVIIECRSVAERVKFTHSVISATRALFSEDKGVEF